MKSKFNNLLKYIYEYSAKEQCRDTINDLFRSVLEPLVQNQRIEACILMRIFDIKDKEASLKRIAFSGFKIYNFGSKTAEISEPDCQKEDIWENSEFLIVLSGRYSAALIWDYTTSSFKNYAKVCLLYNSKIIAETAKIVSDNSKEEVIYELQSLLKKYSPDRRENSLMNKSIQTIASRLNDKNEDFLFLEYAKNNISNDDDTLKTAKIITEKAKFTAHEIKNYLSIINLYSVIMEKKIENLQGDEADIDAVKNAVKNISNASDAVIYLINDLRCLSAPDKKQAGLRPLLMEAAALCREKIAAANASITSFEVKDAVVYTDKMKLQCAFTNIVFNALDAGARSIWIYADENFIRIGNDGAEIPAEIQGKIFDENFTTKSTGTGLGLAFCRSRLRLAGGDIRLACSNKSETVFEIKI